MAELVETILQRMGPSLSSDVAAELAKVAHISPEAARQRLSRARGKVRRLAGVPFPRNARFLYLEQQFGSPEYWWKLSAELMLNNSALGFALAALRQAGGMIPSRQFPIICGSPLRQMKHLSADTVLQYLSEAGLVKTVVVPALGECVALVQEEQYYSVRAADMRARLLTEDILITAVRDWLRKLGIASYNLVATRSDEQLPQIGTFVWDLSAPSYLGHMVRFSSGGDTKPGFVACDVNLTERMTIQGVRPFIRKCTTLRALPKVGPCMQIFVADGYEPDAFRALRGAGIIAATPASLFGEEIANALHELTSVLSNVAFSSFEDGRFEELFSTLGRIEGAANQLRGTLFEYIAADAAKRLGLGDVWMNRIFKVDGKGKAEVDVLAIKANHSVTAIECKGYSPRATISDELFTRWLQHNVPVAYKGIREHPDWKNLPVTFEFWTTAPISQDAFALFESAKSQLNPNRYNIELRGPVDVWQNCKQTGERSLMTAHQKHFLLPDGAIPLTVKPERAVPEFAAVTDDWWN
ncbi:hypothetical protein JQK15_26265 [Sphingobium sp. BHU LFT2]|uniref:hypothetical protein n=1 Tax=Sphingobium sp. BHU LFT2 TaxID=2807634 RepID=UPI001BE713C8|nr:hypothetical protein [Sphingobium sp. BHU LFT2]MBT2247002.1 hypothetical protein [Sphingobium sp. BHU LFT2]